MNLFIINSFIIITTAGVGNIYYDIFKIAIGISFILGWYYSAKKKQKLEKEKTLNERVEKQRIESEKQRIESEKRIEAEKLEKEHNKNKFFFKSSILLETLNIKYVCFSADEKLTKSAKNVNYNYFDNKSDILINQKVNSYRCIKENGKELSHIEITNIILERKLVATKNQKPAYSKTDKCKKDEEGFDYRIVNGKFSFEIYNGLCICNVLSEDLESILSSRLFSGTLDHKYFSNGQFIKNI